MIISETYPGDQVVVLPEWAFKTLEKKGKVEDLVDFSKVREYFTNDEIVALDAFSDKGLADCLGLSGEQKHSAYSRSPSYIWVFPAEAGNNKNMSEADSYAWQRLVSIRDSLDYRKISDQLCQDLIMGELRNVNPQLSDVSQLYSVYSGSKGLIVLVVKPGILGKNAVSQQPSLRLAVARSILGKLETYYEQAKIAQSFWFDLYLTELSQLR